MTGNLLRAEATNASATSRARTSALLDRTTGNVITVDGGNVAAMLR